MGYTITCITSYQDRFWRETVFQGIAGVRAALDTAYGEGKVAMVSAVFRWMNHHSVLKKDCGGIVQREREEGVS